MLPCNNGYYRSSSGSCTDAEVFKWTSAQVVGLQAITATSSGASSATSSGSSSSTAGASSCPSLASNSAAQSTDCSGAQRTIGLGVGLGLGLPLLAAVAAGVFLCLAGRRRTSAPAYEGVSTAPEEKTPPREEYPPPRQSVMSEIAGQQMQPTTQELDGRESSGAYMGGYSR